MPQGQFVSRKHHMGWHGSNMVYTRHEADN